jgi:23S rRNA pseudouridine1911/1915/1917 synthase
MRVHKQTRVTPAQEGRADRVVQELTGLTRSWVRGIFDHHLVKVNGTLATGAAHEVKAGDLVAVDYDKDRRYKEIAAPRTTRFRIVYEDEHLIVVDKAPGILSVPTGKGEQDTLVHEIARYLSKGPRIRTRVHIVHRLDRGTSGILVFAKSAAVAHRLKLQFAQRKPEREYIAIVAGQVKDDAGTFRSHLATARDLDQYSTDDEDRGKLAVTHFTVEKRLVDATVVRVQLETGRRNQIRVHFAEAGHPVIGDERYRTDISSHPLFKEPRLALHAASLGFKHPMTGEAMRFTSKTPGALQRFIIHNSPFKRRQVAPIVRKAERAEANPEPKAESKRYGKPGGRREAEAEFKSAGPKRRGAGFPGAGAKRYGADFKSAGPKRRPRK